MEAQVFHWLWWGFSLASDLTGTFAFIFALAIFFNRKPNDPWYMIPLGLLSLCVAILAFVASMQFHYWARLATR